MESMVSEIRQLAREEASRLFDEKFKQFTSAQQSEHVPLLDFCREKNVSPPTVYRKIDKGHLSLFKFGNKAYLNRSEANALFIRVK